MWLLGALLLRRSRPRRHGSTAGAELALICVVAVGLGVGLLLVDAARLILR
jgi:hypothetical protein